MPSATDALVARPQADCLAAEAAERAVDLDRAGVPLSDEVAARCLGEIEADVTADALAVNRSLRVDGEGRNLHLSEVAR